MWNITIQYAVITHTLGDFCAKISMQNKYHLLNMSTPSLIMPIIYAIILWNVRLTFPVDRQTKKKLKSNQMQITHTNYWKIIEIAKIQKKKQISPQCVFMALHEFHIEALKCRKIESPATYHCQSTYFRNLIEWWAKKHWLSFKPFRNVDYILRFDDRRFHSLGEFHYDLLWYFG